MRPYLTIKRILDLIISIILIIFLSPLFIFVSIAIKIDSPGPVFYRQARTGLHYKDFTLIKFRSMTADNDVYDFKTRDKITKVGHFIRKTSLDELPQLINIVRGDMSFVGPRPWLPILNDYYTENQKRRFLVRPGITGLAQVSGRKDLNIIDRINYDIDYVERVSFGLDLEILFKTVLVIFNNDDNTRHNYSLEDELKDLINYYEN